MAASSPAPSQAELKLRNALTEDRPPRGTWIRIAGPICAVLLGVFGAAMYLRPIEVLRFIQKTRLGWSGVSENELALNDGLVTYFMTGGYPNQEPLILIHGVGPNAALEWRSMIATLAQAHYKVIAPNLPGFASSDHKQVRYSIAYQAAALAGLIDKLKLEKVNLVGHDLGADVALYYAVDHPDNVERLILVSGGMIGQRDAERIRASLVPNTPDKVKALVDSAFFGLPPMPDFMYERMMAALASDLPAQTDMLNSAAKDEAHIRSKLGQIFNTLTVIMWGGKDPVIPAAREEALHSALPGSATVIFRSSGHDPQLEHPDEFADSILYLLRQTEGGN
ncbi:MAG: alpha/beta hydrolase [Candidatus Binataceae bacterium]